MASEREFPVLWPWDRERHAQLVALGCPRSVPWSLVAPHERQARANHSQSLERLAERGGLSPSELVAVLSGESLTYAIGRPATETVPLLLALLSEEGPTDE